MQSSRVISGFHRQHSITSRCTACRRCAGSACSRIAPAPSPCGPWSGEAPRSLRPNTRDGVHGSTATTGCWSERIAGVERRWRSTFTCEGFRDRRHARKAVFPDHVRAPACGPPRRDPETASGGPGRPFRGLHHAAPVPHRNRAGPRRRSQSAAGKRTGQRIGGDDSTLSGFFHGPRNVKQIVLPVDLIESEPS